MTHPITKSNLPNFVGAAPLPTLRESLRTIYSPFQTPGKAWMTDTFLKILMHHSNTTIALNA